MKSVQAVSFRLLGEYRGTSHIIRKIWDVFTTEGSTLSVVYLKRTDESGKNA